MSERGKLQQNIAGMVGTEGRAALTLPADWPVRIQCPGCGEWQDAGAYHVLGRKRAVRDNLHPVLICKRRGCGQVFSPSAEYLAKSEGGGD